MKIEQKMIRLAYTFLLDLRKIKDSLETKPSLFEPELNTLLSQVSSFLNSVELHDIDSILHTETTISMPGKVTLSSEPTLLSDHNQLMPTEYLTEDAHARIAAAAERLMRQHKRTKEDLPITVK